MNILDNDTIVAPATPPGEGGIGILRLSGGRAEELVSHFFHPVSTVNVFESHRLYLGSFRSSDGTLIDEIMMVIMRAPRSYTREDVVEVHTHGGRLIMRRILDQLINAGARLARPGEFTLRAFLSGRLDLSKAEAVIDLIRARSEVAGRMAVAQLEGSVSRSVYEFRSDIVDLLALIEAYIDFPEEDIDFADEQRLRVEGQFIRDRLLYCLKHFEAGRILREGLSVLIFGKPNVGKSSLLNLLLGEARAIVTDIPGTTRDTIEENLVLSGIPLRLVDTAGVRQTDDPVEVEGVIRAKEKVDSADLVLLVIDGSQPLSEDDFLALNACQSASVLLVLNKFDLGQIEIPPIWDVLPRVAISTRSGFGVDQLREAIVSLVSDDLLSGDADFDGVFSDRRHREALHRCSCSIQFFLDQLDNGVAPEFLALELREALQALGEITGETTPDHILDRIFSNFCIGK